VDVITARAETNTIIEALVGGLTPAHHDMQTPCRKWAVHELIGHMVGGGYMISSALTQDPSAMPDGNTDHLAGGPAGAWAAVAAAMESAATQENLDGLRTLPFGEMPGAVGLSVITADHLTHAWDLARATGQSIAAGDDLCDWAMETWGMVLSDDLRNGDAFDVIQPCADNASGIDKLAAFTGRPVA
jgi:uncharacterized protein (TIGR03086 family)